MKNDRIALYKFLSIAFTYPDEGFDQIMQKAVKLVSTHYRNLNKSGYKLSGIKGVKSALKELKQMSIHQWQGIYTSLFISNYPKTPLHPYESFYKDGLLISDSTDELREIYAECGVEVFNEKEFPDLVSLELEFASFIIENEKTCKPVFKSFFMEHLFAWMPKFFKDTYSYEGTHPFYKGIAQIGEKFLEKEKSVIERNLK